MIEVVVNDNAYDTFKLHETNKLSDLLKILESYKDYEVKIKTEEKRIILYVR